MWDPPRLGLKPVPPAMEAQSPNHWTAREFPSRYITVDWAFNHARGLMLTHLVSTTLWGQYCFPIWQIKQLRVREGESSVPGYTANQEMETRLESRSVLILNHSAMFPMCTEPVGNTETCSNVLQCGTSRTGVLLRPSGSSGFPILWQFLQTLSVFLRCG